MTIEISLKDFKEKYIELPQSMGVDPKEVYEYITSIYGEAPAYPEKGKLYIDKIRDQAQQICDKMSEIGFANFGGLMAKFKAEPSKEQDIFVLKQIKETMEATLYLVEHSVGMSKTELAAQYKDREFACEEGTLTNLQGILAEMSLGKQGLEAYVIEQKKQMVTQIAMGMYNKGKFVEFPWAYRYHTGMEIHNITALVNSVAEDYGLRKKSQEEDHYLSMLHVSSYSQKKLLQELDTMVDGIATNVSINLPQYSEGKCSKAIGALLSGKIDIAKNHLEGARESMSMLTAKKSEKEKLVGSIKSKKEEVKGKKAWASFLKEKAGTLQSQEK